VIVIPHDEVITTVIQFTGYKQLLVNSILLSAGVILRRYPFAFKPARRLTDNDKVIEAGEVLLY
jgi:hypothetical protein